MKLTKGMKKALSLLLTGALVIGGANVGAVSADAAETLQWTGSCYIGGWGWTTGGDWAGDMGDNVIAQSTTDSDSTLAITSLGGNDAGVGFEIDNIADFDEPYVTVVASEATLDGVLNFAVCSEDWSVWYAGADCSGDKEETEDVVEVPIAADVTTITGALDKDVTSYVVTAQGRTVTAIYVHEKDVDPTAQAPAESEDPEATEDADVTTPPAVSADPDATEDVEPTEEPTPTVAPTAFPESERTTAEKFDVKFEMYDPSWTATKSEAVTITGNGTYEISATSASEMEDIMMLWLDAPELGYDNDKNIVIAASKITVAGKDYVADNANWWYRDCEDLEEAALGTGMKDDGMKINSRRMNYRNQYNPMYNADGTVAAAAGTWDAFTKVTGDDYAATEIPVMEGDKITLTITVSGMAEKTVVNTPATTGAITPASIASPATAKITVAKKNKNVVVAAGKTKNVKFTAVADTPATQAAVVTATVKGNKKVTAKVVDGKVQIKAAKKAVKGSKATVTLTSTNASGASVKATIKVSVQNKAKKIKAPKKVTIKKGKKAKVTIKIKKAENNKKAITDAVKVSVKKVAKLTKTQIKKGKVILTLKAKKKGSAKMTVKVGSKKAKINVKVK